MSKNYKYFQKKVFEKIMGLKLEKNNAESSYLCKILNKINNYMNIPEGKITRELNMNYIDRMKGLIVSFYDKCLAINELLLNIKQNKRKLVFNKYIAIVKQNNDNNIDADNNEKNKINNIINSCNNFLMNFNFKDFHLIYCSDDKKKNDLNNNNNKKFIEGIQSISLKLDNIIKYLNEVETNYEIYYIIICFIGIKNIAEKIKNSLQKEFKLIKYLYDDKLGDIIRLINEFITGYDINNINEEYQEIYYEDQIDSVLDNYNDDNENVNINNEKDILCINSKFIEKLFITDDLLQNNDIKDNTELNNKENKDNENMKNLFNEKIQNIEDNLDDLITNLTNLNKVLISYQEKNPLLYNPLSFNEKDLEILYIDILQFCNICTTIFYSITINGLGKLDQEAQQNQNKDQDDGKVYEGGYGMSGNGQGMENISKQIEDEEQLLGLRDENNDNNKDDNNNDNNEENKEQDDAFEMKTDFKEDFNKEIKEDENEEKNENSDIEREEDSVENNENNKMGDKDVQDDLSEENKEENKKKKKLDLTDKNVQIDQENNKNKNNDYKEGDDEKNNEKNENVDEDNQQQGESDNEQKDSSENGDSSDNEGEKIEKLDVDKNKEKEKREKKEEEDNENKEEQGDNEDKMEIEEEIEKEENDINPEEKNKNEINKEDNQQEENEEDLMPENIDNKDINKEDDENNSNNKEENDNNSSDEDDNKSMKLDEEEINKEENKEKEEEKIVSNPIANPEKDLGYNPITKNKNTQGNNTAKNTKNTLNELNEEENNNNDIDFDQLENLDQFKEIFDINSVLNNVYKKGKFENQKNKNNQNNEMDIENNKPIEELNEQDQVMDNDFKFENYKDKNENNNNNGLDNNETFEVGYGTNNANNNDKIAKEKNKENKQKIKNENINKQEIKQNNPEENSDNNEGENDEDKIEGIKVLEDNEKDEKLKNKNEKNKSEEDMEEENEEKEDISMNYEENENEEKEEDDKIMKNNNEDLFPKEDMKTEFDKNLIINTELKLSEKEINDQAISLFNTYIENKNQISTDISNSSPQILEQFFNNLLSASQNQIIRLSSLLKTILTPNLQSKLVGNYKTGKRLNMKKIISFIASNYRQDKIWLRRTLPYNRDYYITISIDNSLSMKQNNIGYYALQSMLILVKSLQKVGIDNLSLFGITDDCVELYDYNIEKNMINNEKIKNIINYFKFNFESKNSFDFAMQNFLAKNIQKIENNTINDRNKLKYNINFIISDGRFNKNNVKGLTAVAKEKGILYVFIIIDRYKFEDKNSILNTMTVKYDEKGEIEIEKYLSDFPFQYYTVVQDIEDLPEVLKGILVKWIETVTN